MACFSPLERNGKQRNYVIDTTKKARSFSTKIIKNYKKEFQGLKILSEINILFWFWNFFCTAEWQEIFFYPPTNVAFLKIPKNCNFIEFTTKKTLKITKSICISSIDREKVKGNLGSFLQSHAIFHDLLLDLLVWISISQPPNFLPHRASWQAPAWVDRKKRS